MRITDSTRVSRSGPIAAERAQARGADSATAAAVGDTASVRGIPDTELTPRVRDAIMRLMGEVDALRRELELARARIQHLEQLADTDPLAPIANRRAFVRELSRILSFSERHGTPASLIYFDLNGLKDINDTYGHAAGDAAIVVMANLLMNNVRSSDYVGRLGGDEFGVALNHADHEAAADKAQAIVDKLAQTPLQWNGGTIPLSVAYGVYGFQAGEDPGELLDRADRAMYAQKSKVRGGSER